VKLADKLYFVAAISGLVMILGAVVLSDLLFHTRFAILPQLIVLLLMYMGAFSVCAIFLSWMFDVDFKELIE
jgi:hypothetical protein